MKCLEFSALLAMAQASARVSAACGCQTVSLAAWQRLPMTLELARFEEVATLVDDPYQEATFAEFHPDGTRYESPLAPIAPRYFPYNRCQLARCLDCGRVYLRYNEAGGYFTELRIRALQAALLVDAPL